MANTATPSATPSAAPAAPDRQARQFIGPAGRYFSNIPWVLLGVRHNVDGTTDTTQLASGDAPLDARQPPVAIPDGYSPVIVPKPAPAG